MRILLISTFHSTDGSGLFSRKVESKLLQLGYEVEVLSLFSVFKSISLSNERIYKLFLAGYYLCSTLVRLLLRYDKRFTFLTFPFLPLPLITHSLANKEYDIAICNFTSGLLSFKNLSWLYKRGLFKSILFYGVDMNFYTGGCHYSMGCEQFKQSCSDCPAFQSKPIKHVVSKNFQAKYDFTASHKNIFSISSSQEHHQQILDSKVFSSTPVHKLLMTFESDKYGTFENCRNTIRDRLGISQHVKVYLTRSSSEHRKGNDVLINALVALDSQHFPLKNILIVTIGDNSLSLRLSKHRINHNHYGIADRHFLNQLYAVSDFFVNTSLADGGPMMLTESLLSYVPAISSDGGLARDYIQETVNGYIYNRYDHIQLSQLIRESFEINATDYKKLRLAARSSVVQSTNHDIFNSALQKIIERGPA